MLQRSDDLVIRSKLTNYLTSAKVLVKYLPKLLTENPNTQLRNENTNAAANSVEGSATKRVLPSWMKPITIKNGVVDTTTVIQDQTVVCCMKM